MTCKNCETSIDFPDYRMFNPACLFCGARYIQLLGRRPLTREQCQVRRRQVLSTWMQHGHDEQQLRALAKGPHCTGPEKASESAARSPTKPRSAGRK